MPKKIVRKKVVKKKVPKQKSMSEAQKARRGLARHKMRLRVGGSASNAAAMKKASDAHTTSTKEGKNLGYGSVKSNRTMAGADHIHEFKKVSKKRRKAAMGKTLKHTSRKRKK